jgi:hypothetical protein
MTVKKFSVIDPDHHDTLLQQDGIYYKLNMVQERPAISKNNIFLLFSSFILL